MQFGSSINQHGKFFDVVSFPGSLKRLPYKGTGACLLQGEINEEIGFPGMTVEKMEKMPLQPDPGC
jgi:hypothetical protein